MNVSDTTPTPVAVWKDAAPTIPALLRRIVPGAHPLIVFTILFGVSLVSSPFVYHWQDTKYFFIPWMQASGGLYPWRIYSAWPPVNYPPFCLFVLTVVERARLIFQTDPDSPLTLVLLKFPFMLSHPFGALVCYYGLRRPWGGKTARRVALMYALCAPLFVNAALWGQADALMMLALVVTLVLLANERPVLAGAAMGWALTIKVQAVVLAPILIVYTLRRFGLRRTLYGLAAGIGTLLLICLPFLIAGFGKELLSSYKDAAGFYSFRSLNAMNLWGIYNVVDTTYRHLDGTLTNNDNLTVLGPITFRDIGLILLTGYMAFVLRIVWKRPSVDTLFFGSAMSAFGLFMLATQMHERYVVPAAVLLALPAVFSFPRLALYVGISISAALNQYLILMSNMYSFSHQTGQFPDFLNYLWNTLYFPGCILNAILFVFGSWLYFRTTSAPPMVSEMPTAAAGAWNTSPPLKPMAGRRAARR
jgi:Gpi18-like mannosyltransferase